MRQGPAVPHWPGPVMPWPPEACGVEGPSVVGQGGLISLEDFHFIRE